MKCLVWSVALYAAETWTLMQTDKRRLEAVEMWIWRRTAGLIKLLMGKFSVTTVNEDRQILNSIWQRKHRWNDHVLRHDGLLHEITEGRMKGKPTRGRRRIQTLHDLADDDVFVAFKRAAEDRGKLFTGKIGFQ